MLQRVDFLNIVKGKYDLRFSYIAMALMWFADIIET